MKKQCSKCKNIKLFNDFYKRKNLKSGFDSWCKSCYRNNSINYYLRNKDKAKQYALNNKHKIANRMKKWRNENKEELAQYDNEYKCNRYRNDINYKLSSLLRRRMSKVINRNQKAGSAIKDLGCTLSELKDYLENQFQTGMNWNNHGKWHIDHKKPLSSFNLSNRKEFLEAAHYTNLQPLWAKDNLLKADKI